MLRNTLLALICLAPMSVGLGLIDDARIIGRGDANNDGTVNLTDAVMINNFLFNGGPQPPCMNQADANDDGQVSISESNFIMNWLFLGGPAPPSPGPFNHTCTQDQYPYPGCAQPCR